MCRVPPPPDGCATTTPGVSWGGGYPPPPPWQVRSVCWSADDGRVVTCGMDGAVYEWSVRDAKRTGDYVLKVGGERRERG